REAAPACGPALACSLAPLRAAGSARLVALAVVTDCPGCGRGAATGPLLYAACRRLLRPGGPLAAVTAAARAPGPAGRAIADRGRGTGPGSTGPLGRSHFCPSTTAAPLTARRTAARLPALGPRPAADTQNATRYRPVPTISLLSERREGPRHD